MVPFWGELPQRGITVCSEGKEPFAPKGRMNNKYLTNLADKCVGGKGSAQSTQLYKEVRDPIHRRAQQKE